MFIFRKHGGRAFSLTAAGYLFDKPEWSNMAARIIMSMVKCPYWYEGSQCNMEDSAWHHVCFTEFSTVMIILTSISFLGGTFIEKAWKEIIGAVEHNYMHIGLMHYVNLSAHK